MMSCSIAAAAGPRPTTEMTTLRVKMLTGETFFVAVATSASVEDVKEKIREQIDVPTRHQRLVYAGIPMQDDKTLSDYIIAKEDTLYLIRRLCTYDMSSRACLEVTANAMATKREIFQQPQQPKCCTEVQKNDTSLEYCSKASVKLEHFPRFQVFVKTLVGRTVTVEVGRNDTIEEVKSVICGREGVPPEHQQLFLCGKELQNERTVGYYGVEKDTTLCLSLGLKGGMQVCIKSSSNVAIILEVTYDDRIATLKDKIYEKEGVHPNQYHLVHCGLQLEDDKTVGDYNLQSNTVIHMIKRSSKDSTGTEKRSLSRKKSKKCVSGKNSEPTCDQNRHKSKMSAKKKIQDLKELDAEYTDKIDALRQEMGELYRMLEKVASEWEKLQEVAKAILLERDKEKNQAMRLQLSLEALMQQQSLAQLTNADRYVDSRSDSGECIQVLQEMKVVGWGKVKKGKYRGELVAVKQPHGVMLNHPELVEQLKSAVMLLKQINHPNLVQVIVFDEKLPMFITELLDMSLRQCCEKGKLQHSNKLLIFLDVAYGLHYLHNFPKPIIHRNFSAHSVLLQALSDRLWRAKISDTELGSITQLSNILGEKESMYIPPEASLQAETKVPHTTKLDIYSYGILLCETITCQVPEPGVYPERLLQVKRQSAPLHHLIVNCTSPVPDERPTMATVLEELKQIQPPQSDG